LNGLGVDLKPRRHVDNIHADAAERAYKWMLHGRSPVADVDDSIAKKSQDVPGT
jgi:hypothetical protein